MKDNSQMAKGIHKTKNFISWNLRRLLLFPCSGHSNEKKSRVLNASISRDYLKASNSPFHTAQRWMDTPGQKELRPVAKKH